MGERTSYDLGPMAGRFHQIIEPYGEPFGYRTVALVRKLDDARAIRDALNGQRPGAGAAPPRVVCLCGSTRFYEEFQRANFRETMAGRIVLSVGFYPHAEFSKKAHGEDVGITPEEKAALDELHKRKIDLADEALVLNVGGYVGESTRSEIEYARARGVPVRYLEEPPGEGAGF